MLGVSDLLAFRVVDALPCSECCGRCEKKGVTEINGLISLDVLVD